jgi:hypothetical protein
MLGRLTLLTLALLAAIAPGYAQESGKLLATGGVSQVEGAGGGGLVPWALITGYGTRDAVGGDAHFTYVGLPDFTLQTAGAAVGIHDRLELSFAHEWFDTGSTGAKLGLGKGYQLQMDVIGAKLKLVGDAVYDQDSWMPQIAIGTQFKAADRHALIAAIGGHSPDGVDIYISATKIFLAQSLLVDATVRATKANQFGLLGFGGDRDNGYSPEFEGSAALLLSRNFAVGSEFRDKPNNLSFAKEGPGYDLFAAYFLSKNLSLTAAYVNLGPIVLQQNQQGFYLSLQGGF